MDSPGDLHAQFMAIYQWMMDHHSQLSAAATELVTGQPGLADQMRAAVSEAHRTIGDHRRLLPTADWIDEDPTPRQLTEDDFQRTTALLSAAMGIAKIEYRCPHADPEHQLVGPRPITFLVREGVLTCRSRQCLPDHLHTVIPDDECDLCRAKATFFTPMLLQLGPITVVAHACDWCKEHIPGADRVGG